MKAAKRPYLSKHHKEKCLSWTNKFIKIDISTEIFSYKCRALLDEPDSGVLQEKYSIKTKQVSCDIMFQATTIKSKIKIPSQLMVQEKSLHNQ